MIARAGPPSVHALGLAAVALSLLVAAVVWPLDLLACPFRAATGLPCLGCGCTHAFHFAVRGELFTALSWSPLGTALAFACAVHAAWTALRLCGLPWAPQIDATPALRWTAAAALAANWAFLVVRR